MLFFFPVRNIYRNCFASLYEYSVFKTAEVAGVGSTHRQM